MNSSVVVSFRLYHRMSSTGANQGVTCIEDILSKALWVNGLVDPSLRIDALHDTFMEVIFSFPREEVKHDVEARPRIRTAAERAREREEKRQLREELHDLEDDELIDDEEDIELEEEDSLLSDDEEEMNIQDQEFLDWIRVDREVEDEEGAPATPPPEERKDVELDLTRIGLGIEQEEVTKEELPERYVQIEKNEHRYHLGPKPLPGGFTYDLPLTSESFWILRQLRNAGQPLAHNTRICALASHSLSSIADDAVLVAITYALQKMTREFLEPAHLMMYHQTPLHPLLFALFEDSNLLKAAEHDVPMSSYAYSLKTGARQRPFLSENDVGFLLTTKRSIGAADPQWRHLRGSDFAQRKPCFIELGRLLVRILELDVLCHQLESRRRHLLLLMEGSTEASVQNQRAILEQTVFESEVDVDIWHSFVQTLVSSGHSRSAFQRIQVLGLEDAYEEYTLTGLQYQDNLVHGTPLALCHSHSIRLREWAENVGQRVSPPLSPEAVVSHFNHAIIDQFSKLPVLCRQVLERFCTVGHLIVTHKLLRRPDDVFPLSTFFVEHPHHYLELLQMESQQKVSLFYVLDEVYVRQVLRENELYHAPPSSADAAGIEEEWYLERQSAFRSLVANLIEALVPRVKAELRLNARYHTTCDSVRRLGVLCSQGPYQATRLTLSGYSDDLLLWEPEWNLVESLPVTEYGSRSHQRVCGVFKGHNGVITFAFIDENGSLLNKARWTDLSMSTESGKAAAFVQNASVQKMFEICCPAVVAVAASDPNSLDVMQRVQRFLKEHVYPAMHVRIPVMWAAADVANFFSESHYADAEMPQVDAGLRISVGLARYVQNPLQVLACLFDGKNSATHLLCSASQCSSRAQIRQLNIALSWEMSLWVASVGLWVDDCVRCPNALALMQFIPGFGYIKASILLKIITDECPYDRESFTQQIESSFSSYVALNASPCLRIPPAPLAKTDAILSTNWHPLDQTLIPLSQYQVACYIAAVATRNESFQSHTSLLNLNLIDFLTNSPDARREALDYDLNEYAGILQHIREAHIDGAGPVFGNREVDFIADELIANGCSFARRPFRRMTSKGLLLNVAGTAFFSKAEENANHSSSALERDGVILHEGSYVAGTISRFRGGRNAGIQVVTSRGLRAFISLRSIDDESMRTELLRHIEYQEFIRGSANGAPTTSHFQQYVAPEWLQIGAVIQGIVFQCNWQRCEFFLHWCPPRAGATLEPALHQYVSFSDAMKDGASSANSIRTSQIRSDASIFAKSLSQHPLFRDIGKTDAMDLLRDKEIGEALFRPSATRKSKAICMVKIGAVATCQLVIAEDRNPDGSIYYSYQDSIVKEEKKFSEIDEFLLRCISPMVAKVRNLRNHRRFVDGPHEVHASLTQQSQGTGRFAYVFVENTKSSAPPLYRVYTKGGGKEHRFDLHFSDKFIYVSLPFFTRSEVVYKWVQCADAERLSEVVKTHAIRSK